MSSFVRLQDREFVDNPGMIKYNLYRGIFSSDFIAVQQTFCTGTGEIDSQMPVPNI